MRLIPWEHPYVSRIVLSGFLLLSSVVPATGEVRQAPDTRPSLVAFGDSLTAGLGVGRDDAYPAQLQRRLEELGYQYRVINAGASGDTSAGGLRRIPWVLKSKPEVVILELGANDGLRGLSLEQTTQNLTSIIQQLQEADVTVVLAGMKIPPNYGQDYTRGFESIYPALAKQHHLSLIPFFLEGVAASPALNQADGIHPTKEGYRIVAEQVLKVLKPLLRRAKPQNP